MLSCASLLQTELSDDQRERVHTGERVVFLRHAEADPLFDDEDRPWPEVIVYQITDASPEEVAAVFADYPLHATMFVDNQGCGIVGATPVAQVDACTADVAYTFAVPPQAGTSPRAIHFTLRNHIEATKSSNGFVFSWTKVEIDAPAVKELRGAVRIEQYDGGAVVALEAVIKFRPTAIIMEFWRTRFIHEVGAALGALIEHVDVERDKTPMVLLEQCKALRRALGLRPPIDAWSPASPARAPTLR
ncbi:MAG: hypothetical protein HOW73_28500 [Polyangiaceae bacterium]|nr:hypothetical protein [Polyangiaceae bacterium]